MSEPEIHIDFGDGVSEWIRCCPYPYVRLHSEMYYAEDTNDMEVLEEVKEDKQ